MVERRVRRWWWLIPVALAAVVAVAVVPIAGGGGARDGGVRDDRTAVLGSTLAALPASLPSRFEAMDPVRVLDTRDRTGIGERLRSGVVHQLDLSSQVPEGVTAVVLNVTITEASAPLFVTLWPADKPQPASSSANASAAGDSVANLVTVALSPDRKLSVFASSSTHLLTDLAGFYTPAYKATSGLFRPVSPLRVLDSRESGFFGTSGVTDRELIVETAAAGVPASASAVVANITVIDTVRPGYVAAYPSTPPGVSNVNMVRAGQTVANQVTVKLLDGKFRLLVAGSAQVAVDVLGFYGPSALPSDVGLFRPVSPQRLFDSRDGAAGNAAGGTLSIPSLRFVPEDSESVTAVLFNLTITDVTQPGFVTAWGEEGRPWVSNIYIDRPGLTLPNQVIASQDLAAIKVFSTMSASVVVDVAGYFTAGQPSVTAGEDDRYGRFSFAARGSADASNAGQPVRWDACHTITYAVMSDGAPAFAVAEVQAAVAEMAAVSGLSFSYAGAFPGSYSSSAPLVADIEFRWMSPAQDGRLAGEPVAAAVMSRDMTAGVVQRFVSGRILLDATSPVVSSQPPGADNVVRGVLLHELGHAVGLGHVDLPFDSQRMNPAAFGVGPFSYNFGDRLGLAQLGGGAACPASAPAREPDAVAEVVIVDEHGSHPGD